MAWSGYWARLSRSPRAAVCCQSWIRFIICFIIWVASSLCHRVSRTLGFWRALTAECISSFFYVLLSSGITSTAQQAAASPPADGQHILHIQVNCCRQYNFPSFNMMYEQWICSEQLCHTANEWIELKLQLTKSKDKEFLSCQFCCGLALGVAPRTSRGHLFVSVHFITLLSESGNGMRGDGCECWWAGCSEHKLDCVWQCHHQSRDAALTLHSCWTDGSNLCWCLQHLLQMIVHTK